MLRIAIQGEAGSYSELAAIRYFGRIKTINCQNFTELFSLVGNGADYGFAPIENSIEGIVTQVCDLLLTKRLRIIGESVLRIEHCLIANKGVSIKEVREVYSHPQALAQARRYLERLGIEIVPFSDTAGSIKMIKEKGLRNAAGVASEYAAKVYGMNILKRNIETHNNNYTRFFVLSKNNERVRGRNAKTSIAMITKNTPGSLYHALGCFAENRVNLLYLQSRPVLGKPWEYGFYLECEGSAEEEGLKNAMRNLRKNTDSVRILGSYVPAKKVG